MNKTMACGWCHRSIGDIDAQLSLAAGLCAPHEAMDGCIPARRGGERTGIESSSASSGRVGWADIGRLLLPAMEAAEGVAGVVPCRRRRDRGCQATYCSAACRSAHGCNGHAICCGGKEGDIGTNGGSNGACGGGGGGGDGGGGDDGGSGADGNPGSNGAGGGGESSEHGESDDVEAAAAAATASFRRHCGHHDNLLLMAEVVGRIAGGLSRGDDWAAATLPWRGFVGAPWWAIASEGDAEMERRLKV